jgi:hypothetical protein
VGIAAALPASAVAAPPINDLYVQSAVRVFNHSGTTLGSPLVFDNDTNVEATNGETLPDGLIEPNTCGNSLFGATVWYEFHPHVAGRVQLRAVPIGGFDPVLAFYPFDLVTGRPTRTVPSNCSDDPGNPGATEQRVFDVQARASYKVQVGGYAGTTSAPTAPVTGNFQLRLDFYPDSDGDGVLDFEDRCPTQAGTQSGCPAPPPPPPVVVVPKDRDGDGILDAVDHCPGEDSRGRDSNGDGCLDRRRLLADARLKFRDTADGVRVRSLIVYSVLRDSRIDVSCSRHGKRACKSKTYWPDRAGRWPISHLKGKRLKAGTKINVGVTMRRSKVKRFIGRFQIITIEKRDATKKTYCPRENSRTRKVKC